MVRELPEPNEWCVLETYADRIAAEADAGYLRSESVAAKVEVVSDFPGQERGARLWVDAALAHRARWLLKLGTVSEAELEYLATGKLPARSGERTGIRIDEERPDGAEALQLLAELDTYLLALPYPPESRHAFSVEKLLQQQVAFFMLRYEGQPAGCGGVKIFGTQYGEVKRMYVRPAHRGRGLGKAILDRLAAHALARGAPMLRLETGIYQTEAIGLYERWGFVRRSPFGEYKVDPMSLYFEKVLGT